MQESGAGETMIGYSERDIFAKWECSLRSAAERYIEAVPYELDGEVVRCHELARAVGQMLDLEVADGWYGMIDHSWLWTRKPKRSFFADGVPNILDVYAVGRLPMVQLVSSSPHLPYEYRRGDARKDVRQIVVDDLVLRMQNSVGR